MHATAEGVTNTGQYRSPWLHRYLLTDLCQLGKGEVHEGAVVCGKHQLLTSYERGERAVKL